MPVVASQRDTGTFYGMKDSLPRGSIGGEFGAAYAGAISRSKRSIKSFVSNR